MADFIINGFGRYDVDTSPEGATYNGASNGVMQTATTTDNGSLTQFNPNDDIMMSPGGTRDYAGTVDINGTTYPVFSNAAVTEYFVVVPDGSPTPDWDNDTADFSSLSSSDTFPICFTGDTMVETKHGPMPVRYVDRGDSLLTIDGTYVTVLWVGVQTVDLKFAHNNERLLPVRLVEGALGWNIPNQELTVSNDHAIYVDGILATAGSLVNDTSIFRVPHSEFDDGKITYYHIETDNHELILANNTPAETFIDNISRSAFDNFQEYLDLYGEEREMNELPMPRAMSPRQLPNSIKEKLAQYAIECGYLEKIVS